MMIQAEALTEKQADLFLFLCEREGLVSIREIAKHFGIKSPNGVVSHLQALQRKGFIRRSGKAKQIEITNPVGVYFICPRSAEQFVTE